MVKKRALKHLITSLRIFAFFIGLSHFFRNFLKRVRFAFFRIEEKQIRFAFASHFFPKKISLSLRFRIQLFAKIWIPEITTIKDFDVDKFISLIEE